jgi:hypothetical protein
MCLKEQHPTELQSRNPGPRSNKTNGISSMQPRSRGSFVVFMSRTFTIFAWFRQVNNLHLLLFYLQYPPPVCLVCCIPRVQTIFATFLSLVSTTYLRALPPILGQNRHVAACVTFLFRCPAAHLHVLRLRKKNWNEIAALNRSNATKKKRSSIHPLKPLKKCEGTAPNRTAKQEPRTKIQQNKRHFFHAPQVKGFICGVHVLYLHDIWMV